MGEGSNPRYPNKPPNQGSSCGQNGSGSRFCPPKWQGDAKEKRASENHDHKRSVQPNSLQMLGEEYDMLNKYAP
uniref:Uncharacterized protein n=1 Tax=Ciona savignyi TaxID=51511 RepID=H2YKD5_CIOSA